jgi:hypothetical protein
MLSAATKAAKSTEAALNYQENSYTESQVVKASPEEGESSGNVRMGH